MKNEMMPSTEILEMPVTLLKQHEEQIRGIKEQQEAQAVQLTELKKRIKQIETSCLGGTSSYFSVIGYAFLRGVKHIDWCMADEIERHCIQLSKEQDLKILIQKDELHGTVNIYHPDILFAAFNAKGLLQSPEQKSKW